MMERLQASHSIGQKPSFFQSCPLHNMRMKVHLPPFANGLSKLSLLASCITCKNPEVMPCSYRAQHNPWSLIYKQSHLPTSWSPGLMQLPVSLKRALDTASMPSSNCLHSGICCQSSVQLQHLLGHSTVAALCLHLPLASNEMLCTISLMFIEFLFLAVLQ